MNNKTLSLFFVLLMSFISLSIPVIVVASDNNCELPPGIDEGKRYVIKFLGIKPKKFKILEIKDCWIQTYRKDNNHRWFPISNIVFIGSKGEDK
jgi:hypothetical protein